jgi:hypothetical protein
MNSSGDDLPKRAPKGEPSIVTHHASNTHTCIHRSISRAASHGNRLPSVSDPMRDVRSCSCVHVRRSYQARAKSGKFGKLAFLTAIFALLRRTLPVERASCKTCNENHSSSLLMLWRLTEGPWRRDTPSARCNIDCDAGLQLCSSAKAVLRLPKCQT